MPFIAKIRDTGERLNIQDYERVESLAKEGIVCPFCDGGMYIRGGDRTAYRRHFAHRIECGADWLPEEYASGLETPEHLSGKEWLRLNFRHLLGDEFIKGTTAEYEIVVHVPAYGNLPARKRIADVMITFPNGRQIALECQLASITPDTLTERTNDYQRAGVDVRWVLGKAAANPQNCGWCEDTFGVCYRFDFSYASKSYASSREIGPTTDIRSFGSEVASYRPT